MNNPYGKMTDEECDWFQTKINTRHKRYLQSFLMGHRVTLQKIINTLVHNLVTDLQELNINPIEHDADKIIEELVKRRSHPLLNRKNNNGDEPAGTTKPRRKSPSKPRSGVAKPPAKRKSKKKTTNKESKG